MNRYCYCWTRTGQFVLLVFKNLWFCFFFPFFEIFKMISLFHSLFIYSSFVFVSFFVSHFFLVFLVWFGWRFFFLLLLIYYYFLKSFISFFGVTVIGITRRSCELIIIINFFFGFVFVSVTCISKMWNDDPNNYSYPLVFSPLRWSDESLENSEAI